MSAPCTGHAAESERDEWMAECRRLIRELIEAAHTTIIDEDLSDEDEASAALLDHAAQANRAVSGVPNWSAEGLSLIVTAALYDFGGYITTRDEQLRCSSTDNAGPTAEAIAEFLRLRGVHTESEVPVLSWQEWLAAAPAAPVELVKVPLPEPDDHGSAGYTPHAMRDYGDAREAAGYARGVAAQKGGA